MSPSRRCGACAALAVAMSTWACGSDEPLRLGVAPAPEAGAPGSDDAAVPPPSPDAGTEDAGPPVRRVETRPRFGSLDPTNLLLDGDLEYSGMNALQYAWFGVDYSWIVTGARCRQGLRCLEIPRDEVALGLFVWPSAPAVEIEYFAKPAGAGSCVDEVGGLVLPLGDYPGAPPGPPARVSASEPAPDADGWCHVTASVPVPADTGNVFWALLLAPRQSATGSLLIDEASIRPSDASGRTVGTAAWTVETARLVSRARAARPPLPPRAERPPVVNRTGHRRRR